MTNHFEYRNSIQKSNFDIYTPIEVGDQPYWIPTVSLEYLLNAKLVGLSLDGLALRTRSKIVKEAVCAALGYPVPKSFKRTKPRFLGQQLDICTQKARNVQIYNEELSPSRRYAIVQISEHGVVLKVKVVNGQELAMLDTTGKITRKYQASLSLGSENKELISSHDTFEISQHIQPHQNFSAAISPVDDPASGYLLPIKDIFSKLSQLINYSFTDPGMDQERNRGAVLHSLICQCLGYSRYEDNGRFPDIRHQLLEVKLQTSPTIDLGLIQPNSTEHLDIPKIGNYHPLHCDTRYALFYAAKNGATITLTHLFVTTGTDFFTRFRRFEGKVTNGKIQIPLPRGFWD